MLKGALGAADRFAVIDVETTGLYKTDRIVEIAIVSLDRSGTIIDEWDTLVNPGRDVGPVHIHGVTASMVSAAPRFEDIAGIVARRVDGAVLAAHNLAFDRRMVQQEFQRVGATFSPGLGICTLGLAGGKLADACRRLGVEHTQAHRALGDARAASGLLQRLGPSHREPTRPSMAACASSPAAVPTVRRDHFPNVFAPMPYLARLASGLHHYGEHGEVLAYLDMLDWALADLTISASEASVLRDLATELGLDDLTVAAAHQRYLTELAKAAKRDGHITIEEQQLLVAAADALGLNFDEATSTDGARPSVRIAPGLTVCFTGTAVNSHGSEIPRLDLMRHAARLGLTPVDKFTRKTCQLLVAADINTVSGKATKALRWNIPIVLAEDFLSARVGDQLTAR